MAQKPTRAGARAPATSQAPRVQNADAGGIFLDEQDATDLAPRDFADGDATGFVENMRAGFDSMLRSGLMVSRERSRSIAYDPIMRALNAGVEPSRRLTNPYLGASRGNGGGRIRQHEGTFGIDMAGPWAGVTPEEQEATVWAEIARRRKVDPGFLPGIPATREALHAKVDDEDRQALEADDDVAKRATLWGSAGGFVGSVGGAMRDPINIMTLPLGAGASRTILGAAVKQGAIGATITGIAQPQIADRNVELGRDYGLDEAITSTLYGGIGGVVFGGGGKVLGKGAQKLGRRIVRSKMHQITAIAESGNRDFNERGELVTSSAGARGRMQVLDGTNRDPGFGVKPARDNSPAERARVGRDYLDAMMRRYKNDPRKAWAAYNWGAGHVDDAIAKYGANWLDHAPAETRKYVRKNVAALGREYGQGANWLGPVDADPVFPPATADQVSAAITLEGMDELARTSPLPATPAGEARHIDTLQTHIDAIEDGAPRPEASVEPIELRRPEAVQLDRYDPRTLVVDPQRFQFKGGGDADGVLDTLRGVKEWNPILSGKAVVWLDEKGVPHVADGHQRVGLARRLIGENPAADIAIDAVTLRAEDGITAEMARTWAALKNVAEGSGSPIDAAKVLRATGDGTPIPLPPRSALVRDARSLAALSDDAFGMVVNEIVPPAYAALVGRLAPGAPELHAAYLQLLHRLEPATITQADSIVRQAIAAGATRETQLGLFGEEIVSRSLYLERARILDNSLRRLKNDKRIFRTLIEARDDIEGAGNVLAADANAAKVETNAQALEILTRLAHRTGPVSDALGRAAGELAAGRSAKAAVDRFIAEIDGLDLSELARGVERGGGDGVAPGGPGREASAGEPAGGMDRGPAGSDAGGSTGGADDGLGEPIGTDLFGNPVYAERADIAGELDGVERIEAAVDDAQQGFQLDGFSEAHGAPAAMRQTELLEHDIRMEAEQARQAAQDVRGEPIAAPGTILTRDAVTAAQRGRSLDELLSNAARNQDELGRVGTAIAAELGTDFKNPGPKGRARIEEKIANEGYDDAGDILDYARGAFVVDTAEQADAVLARLLQTVAVHDKGWKRLGSGYTDRKLILQFANGGTAEVQIVPRAVWDYRKAAGHALYEEARAPGTPEARVEELNRQMADGYDAALAASTFDQSAGKGTVGNSAEKPATSSGDPSTGALDTKPGADAQTPADRDQANPLRADPDPTTATGRPSTSNSRTDIDTPDVAPPEKVGAKPQNVNAALSWDAPATRQAIADHNAGALAAAAIDIVISTGNGSTSHLARKLGIGMAEAAKIMERLEADGVVSPIDAKGQRTVARLPLSQASSSADNIGSGPRSSTGSGGRSSVDGSALDGTQPASKADSARTPAGEDVTSVGFPQYRTNEVRISPPDERVGTPADNPRLFSAEERVNPDDARRASETQKLAVGSPLRSTNEQFDVDGLGLFDHARAPELFALTERLDADRGAVPELRTADDLLADLDAEDAAIAAIEKCLV